MTDESKSPHPAGDEGDQSAFAEPSADGRPETNPPSPGLRRTGDQRPAGAAPASPARIVIEGPLAARVTKLIQMHGVAGQLDAGDADAMREAAERQLGRLLVGAVR